MLYSTPIGRLRTRTEDQDLELHLNTWTLFLPDHLKHTRNAIMATTLPNGTNATPQLPNMTYSQSQLPPNMTKDTMKQWLEVYEKNVSIWEL